MRENIIDGQPACWRCGLQKNSQEIRDGLKCCGWGKCFRTHLWKIKEVDESETQILR